MRSGQRAAWEAGSRFGPSPSLQSRANRSIMWNLDKLQAFPAGSQPTSTTRDIYVLLSGSLGVVGRDDVISTSETPICRGVAPVGVGMGCLSSCQPSSVAWYKLEGLRRHAPRSFPTPTEGGSGDTGSEDATLLLGICHDLRGAGNSLRDVCLNNNLKNLRIITER